MGVGRYRARDLLLPPGWVSLSRVPLAVAFPFVEESAAASLVVLSLAALTDVVDGYLARRLDMATPTGAVLDGITDKLFVATVVVSLVASGRLPAWGVVPLAMRELGELPLVAWWLVSRPQRKTKADEPKANWIGKAATVLQFVTVVACILGTPAEAPLLMATGVTGAIAAAFYWRRELSAWRRVNGDPGPRARTGRGP